MNGKVLVASVSALWAAGFTIVDADPWAGCLGCGCPTGLHDAVMPGGTSPFQMLLRGGHLECPTCNRSCATWTVALPGDGC